MISYIQLSSYGNVQSRYTICGVKLGTALKRAKSIISKNKEWSLKQDEGYITRYVDGEGNELEFITYSENPGIVGCILYSLN